MVRLIKLVARWRMLGVRKKGKKRMLMGDPVARWRILRVSFQAKFGCINKLKKNHIFESRDEEDFYFFIFMDSPDLHIFLLRP